MKSATKKPATQPDIIARAAAGTCQYLERDDHGKLHECGMEAAWRGRAGGRLFYCSRHGEYVGRQLAVIALAAGPDGRRAEIKPWKDYRS